MKLKFGEFKGRLMIKIGLP